LVTTETRGLRPEDLRPGGKPLVRLQATTRPWAVRDGRALLDVTDFVARKPTLSSEVSRTVFDGSRRPAALAGTPLSPRWAARRPTDGTGRVALRRPEEPPLRGRSTTGWATPGRSWSNPTPIRPPRPATMAPPSEPTAAQRLRRSWATPEEGWSRGGATLPPRRVTPGSIARPPEALPIVDQRRGWRVQAPAPEPIDTAPSQRFVPRDPNELPRLRNERPPVLRLVPGQRRDLRPGPAGPVAAAPTPSGPPLGWSARRLAQPPSSAATAATGKPSWAPAAKPQPPNPQKPERERDREH
jgi:hypothetical protein